MVRVWLKSVRVNCKVQNVLSSPTNTLEVQVDGCICLLRVVQIQSPAQQPSRGVQKVMANMDADFGDSVYMCCPQITAGSREPDIHIRCG